MVFVLLAVLGAHTKTTATCHFFRAIHEHNRTHEHIPILLEVCELVTFSSKADRTVCWVWSSEGGKHSRNSPGSYGEQEFHVKRLIRTSLVDITIISKNVKRKRTIKWSLKIFITQRSRQTVTKFLRPRVEFSSLTGNCRHCRAVTTALFSREVVASRNQSAVFRLRVSWTF